MNARIRTVATWIASVAAVLLLVLGAFPWGALRGLVERRASAAMGRPVTIGAAERLGWFGFHPTIALRDVRVPQPEWAGPGDLARLREARVRFSAWALLTGDFRVEDLSADGLRLSLVRRADRRVNWRRENGSESGGGGSVLTGLTLRDARVSYRDAVQDRSAMLNIAADPAAGLRATGTAVIRGAPAELAVVTAPLTPGRPWPIRADVTGERIAMTVRGVADRPLDLGHATLDVRARAADLKLIDAVIEAGLFGTQPVTLTARARHDGDRWDVSNLSGTIGQSRLSGGIKVDKVEGRTKLDGRIVASALDFQDLSTDAGNARGQALERRIGPKLVPNTRVDIGKITRTDGRIAFRVERIVSRRRPSALRTASGVMVLDHQLLTVSPLRIGFRRGAITGRAVVDQRGGRAQPIVTLDLRLVNSDVAALAGGTDEVSARVDARAVLRGRGSTVREAVGRADGRIGLVVRDGALPARVAAALGFDAGRALMAGGDAMAGLRCGVANLRVSGGTARTGTLVVDTSLSRLDGRGTLSFPTEALDFRLSGAPKRNALLRLSGGVYARGTLRAPRLVVSPDVRSAGNILKAIGRAIGGQQGPIATPANCDALSAAALR